MRQIGFLINWHWWTFRRIIGLPPQLPFFRQLFWR